MSEVFTIEPFAGNVMVRAGGAVLAESTRTLILREGTLPPVYYFPREDAGMAFLERSETRTTCPHKGEATHYDLVVKSEVIRDAAWSYEDPIEAATRIAGHVAFYPEKVTVSAS